MLDYTCVYFIDFSRIFYIYTCHFRYFYIQRCILSQIHMLFQILLYGYVCYFRYMSYFRYFYMDVHVISDTFDACGILDILETFYMVFWINFTRVCIHYFIDVLFYIDVHIMFMSYVHVECMYVFNIHIFISQIMCYFVHVLQYLVNKFNTYLRT